MHKEGSTLLANSSKKIRGITIEMSADATEVISEIHKVDKATKNTQTQLRDVEKLLKFDPGNTELLAQKQRLLAEAAEEAQKKEKLLYKIYEERSEQFEHAGLTLSLKEFIKETL